MHSPPLLLKCCHNDIGANGNVYIMTAITKTSLHIIALTANDNNNYTSKASHVFFGAQ
jgi:hypothetical protein